MTLAWRAAGATHVGRVRKGNEDTFVLDPERGVFLVADGMGGHAAGEVASALAAETIGGALRDGVDQGLGPETLSDVMTKSFCDADLAIAEHVEANPRRFGMGTTVTACVLSGDGGYLLGHIGDSRAYLVRDGVLAQVTRDHTWVQREVDEGRLTAVGARRHRLSHILTRALGTDPLEPPDIMTGELYPGDQLLLCSDGLTGMVTDRELGRILKAAGTPDDRVDALIKAANAKGGRDNVTAVLVEVTARVQMEL